MNDPGTDLLIEDHELIPAQHNHQLNGGHQRNLSQKDVKEMSQPVFDELQRVKAERDLFYEKLMRVRSRIEQGKGQRQQAMLT